MGTIDLNQLNHFILKKQHLIDESQIDDVVQVIRDIGGLHSTIAKTPYLSLFSRVRNFKRDKLGVELYDKRTLGKIRCIRKTIYTIPKERISFFYSATRNMVELISERYYKYLGVTQEEYKETSKKILEILKGRGMATKEIKGKLGTKLNISPIVNFMCDKGLLMRGKPRKGWKSNIHTYYLFHEFFPDVDLTSVNEAEAKEFVVKQYLSSFGPVTENDVTWWTGFPKRQILQILESFSEDIIQIEINSLKGKYIMSSSDEKK